MAIREQIQEIDLDELRYEDGTTVVGQPAMPGLGVREMQLSMENLGRNVLVPLFNRVIQLLNTTYSREETDTALEQKVVEVGAGDMAKRIYDPQRKNQDMFAYAETKATEKAAELQETLAAKRVTLTAEGWSATAPYTQAAAVTGVTAVWVPGHPVVAADSGNEAAMVKAATCLSSVTSENGRLVFCCLKKKPDVDMTLYIPRLIT